jgi:hypothetical protein
MREAGKHTWIVMGRTDMSHRAVILGILALSLTVLAACTKLSKRESDSMAGEYEGTFTPQGGQAIKAEAKVIADENNKYRVVILYPAATAQPTRIELTGRSEGHEISVTSLNWLGKCVDERWSGTITENTLHIVAQSPKGGQADMKRVAQKDLGPTLGKRPPAGAVVLLPFEKDKPTNLDQWTNKEWTCEPDGSIQVHRGDNRTIKEFGNFKLHLEFYVPFLPSSHGQARGGSGVYLHNRYKIQILDSFGEPLTAETCGAIMGRNAPNVNAAILPGQWQTYDIDFKSPQFDGTNGLQIRGAVVTVLLNGVKIHDAVEMTGMTGGALGVPSKTGPLRLQDRNDPVRFRNIWLVEEK